MAEPKPVLLECLDISANHTGLSSAIFPCSYVEIRDNHMCLVSAIISMITSDV
jgi:hypothetical protein